MSKQTNNHIFFYVIFILIIIGIIIAWGVTTNWWSNNICKSTGSGSGSTGSGGKITGGIETESGQYKIHHFTYDESNQLKTLYVPNIKNMVSVECIIIGGGGGGGSIRQAGNIRFGKYGAGGGAGQFIQYSFSLEPNTHYIIIVGNGGNGGNPDQYKGIGIPEGSSGKNGKTSYIYKVTNERLEKVQSATGGYGANGIKSISHHGPGGNSGNGGNGGEVDEGYIYGSGGGAGDSGNGGNAGYITAPNPYNNITETKSKGGDGGNGREINASNWSLNLIGTGNVQNLKVCGGGGGAGRAKGGTGKYGGGDGAQRWYKDKPGDSVDGKDATSFGSGGGGGSIFNKGLYGNTVPVYGFGGKGGDGLVLIRYKINEIEIA